MSAEAVDDPQVASRMTLAELFAADKAREMKIRALFETPATVADGIVAVMTEDIKHPHN